MALQRLRESIDLPRSYYQELTEVPENLKESFKAVSANKKLQESESVTSLIKAAEKLRESSNDKAIFDKIISKLKEEGAAPARKLWKFPVSRFGNKNGNGRVYPRELWENVIDNQRATWQGGCGLADHPRDDDDPGEFKTSSIVWLDMMIDDANKLIWAIGTFVGTYGKLAQEIIEAGGHVGFSSSGFGEPMSDGVTINPDTYMIERVADIVTNPSQKVFGDLSSESNLAITPAAIEYGKQVKESVEPRSNILKEKTMAAVDAVKLTESAAADKTAAVKPIMENEALSKLEQKAIEKYVESFQLDAEKIKKPTDRLREVNEILSMVQNGANEDLRKKVEEQLVSARDELEQMVEGAVNLQDTFGTKDLNKLGEQVKTVATQGKLLNDQVNDYKVLCEGLTQRNQDLYRENQLLKTKVALKDKAIQAKDLRANKRTVNESVQFDAINEELNSVKEENETLKEQNDKLNRGNRKLEEQNGVLETRLREVSKHSTSLKENTTKTLNEVNTLNNQIDGLKGQIAAYEEQISRLQKKNSLLQEQYNGKVKEFEQFKTDSNPELHIQPKFESYVSDSLNLRENKGVEIENYWNGLVQRYGESVKPFEQQIRGAKTYREAFNAFLKNRDSIDHTFAEGDEARISENVVSRQNRKVLLEEAGMKFDTGADDTVESVNKAELEKMKKMGLR